ncbi:MAG: acyltransferase [Chitinophagia bacterium]|nr:acyltransferase [Chitinophagia bacterium]
MFQQLYQRLQRVTTHGTYLPEVDGLRFVAIVMVVLFHLHTWFLHQHLPAGDRHTGTPGHRHSWGMRCVGEVTGFTDKPDSYALLNTLTLNGDRGVELFFMLSGFILALPFARHFLLGDKKPALQQYYLRRLWRIEPPYFIALSGIFLLHLLSPGAHVAMLVRHYLASLGYSHLLIYHTLPMVTTVAWTLEIEVQFYLVAPLLFQVFRLRVWPRRLILVGLLIGITLFHHYFIVPPLRWTLPRFLPYFLTGILVADAYLTNALTIWFRQWWVPVLAPLLFVALFFLHFKTQLPDALLFPLFSGALLLSVLHHPLLRRLFSGRVVTTIGGMCYSIYLLHYTIISGLGRWTIHLSRTHYYLPDLLIQCTLLGAGILVLSTLFYLLVERTFMRRK